MKDGTKWLSITSTLYPKPDGLGFNIKITGGNTDCYYDNKSNSICQDGKCTNAKLPNAGCTVSLIV